MGQDVGRPKSPAIWRWGFIFGGSAGALGIIAAVATLAMTAGFSLLLDAVFVLLVLGLYFGGGLMVARQTGSVGAATLSGVVAGIFSAILREIAAVFITYNRPLPTVAATGFDVGSLRTVLVIISVLFVLMIFGGLGAGLAALGGLAGRPRPAMPYPMMYPGSPGFQPQGYPVPQGYAPPPPPGYPMPQGYAPPPGYPMPQGFGPSGYAPPGYPATGWYPPAPAVPAYPPPLPDGAPATAGSRTDSSFYPPVYPPVTDPSSPGAVQAAPSGLGDTQEDTLLPAPPATEQQQPVYPPPPPALPKE